MKVAALTIVVGIGLLTPGREPDAQPAIYRCAVEGGVVYTDRPCEGGAEPHEIDDSRVTIYAPEPAAEPAPIATPTKQSKVRRAKSGLAADPDQHRIDCLKIEQRLRDVRTRMRTGYGAREGERLKVRQRQLNEQRRAQKCR